MKNRISASKIFWGLLLIGVAAVLILEGIGVGDVYGVSVPSIALAILLVVWTVYLCVKKKFYMVFLPLGLLYTFVIDKPLAKALNLTGLKEDGRIIPVWIVIVAAVLLCIAFKVLFTKKNYSSSSTTVSSGKVGNSTIYFDASDLSNAQITESLGNINAYIANPGSYAGGGVIRINGNMGNITLHLPSDWLIVTDIGENIGKVYIPDQPGPTNKSITLVITENVGRVCVVFTG